MGTTTIQVSEELADELAERKRRGDTYEHVIRRLLEADQRGRGGAQAVESADAAGGEGQAVECSHCGHEWDYGGSAAKPTCPSCTRKTPV